MSRLRTCAIAAFVLALAGAPFLPRAGDGDPRAVTRSAGSLPLADATAGMGRLTPALRAEVDRVVAAGASASAALGRPAAWTPRRLAAALVRCADFEGQRYCLGTGWTRDTPQEVRDRVAAAAAASARRSPRESTGDLAVLDLLRRTASLPPARRAALERAELEAAARAVAKVWLLRHQVEGVPLPKGFLARHPEVSTAHARTSTTSTGTTTRRTTWRDYPRRKRILDPRLVREQNRTYWCGPSAMQSIAWNWTKRRQTQRTWARRLGTTTSGSALSAMVEATNRYTGWDDEAYAGPYIMLDVGSYSFEKWYTLLTRHVAGYRAPVILHPLLHRRYFPYLDDDASGHFQVGRGYRIRDGRRQIGYFEPWNQQRFDPSEPYISRVQWRSAYRSYRANLAHPHQNIGV